MSYTKTMTIHNYNLYKTTEGGRMRQVDAIALAKELGAKKVFKVSSPYVGMYGLEVHASNTVHNRITKAFYR